VTAPRRDLGDFQTPRDLAAEVLRTLDRLGLRWSRLLEPTCGTGTFLRAALEREVPPRELIGVEIQESHCNAARALADDPRSPRLRILRSSIFDLDLRNGLPWQDRGRMLVVGNPPWITSAALGRIGSANQPGRRNVKSLSGLQALTGASNFDMAEAIWIKLLEELAAEKPTIALLCKTTVARAVLEHIHRRGWPVSHVAIHQIDAARWFGAAVGACLFQVTLGEGGNRFQVPVFPALEEEKPAAFMGFHQGRLVADTVKVKRYSFALGVCTLNWRQGLKHDAAPVMELTRDEGTKFYRNGLGERVDIEPAFRYPLLKGNDLRQSAGDRPSRAVIVTQERLGQDTSLLEHEAPRLWAYLQRHSTRFTARKSSIYRRKPPFSLFGVGPYCFAPYKVVVCGLHRPARFQAVGSVEGRPIQLDDTCYLHPCQSAAEAALLTAVCNQPMTLGAIEALSFTDAKRPVTKGLLQRIDLLSVLKRVDRAELLSSATTILIEHLGLDSREDLDIAEALVALEHQLQSPTSRHVPPEKRRGHGLCPDQLPQPVAPESLVGKCRLSR
jgi:hypothetical protein